jgi:hypothetical protein
MRLSPRFALIQGRKIEFFALFFKFFKNFLRFFVLMKKGALFAMEKGEISLRRYFGAACHIV